MYHGKEIANDQVAQICERIWLSIAQKRLRPGARLKEEELAEIFDVSRTRVRQALSVLERDGLVTILPNRGAFVSEPTVNEAREVFRVRKFIEGRVIERLIEQITDADFPRLEAHLEEEKAAIARGDNSASVRLLGGFHLLLGELCGSAFLYGILRDVVSRSTLIMAMYRGQHEHNCGPVDHEHLIRVIRDRLAEPALAAMREHLDHVEAELDLTEEIPVVRDLREALI